MGGTDTKYPGKTTESWRDTSAISIETWQVSNISLTLYLERSHWRQLQAGDLQKSSSSHLDLSSVLAWSPDSSPWGCLAYRMFLYLMVHIPFKLCEKNIFQEPRKSNLISDVFSINVKFTCVNKVTIDKSLTQLSVIATGQSNYQ